MDGLTEGRIVHFVLKNGEHRAAIVVKVWSKDTGLVNLHVFHDGGNDTPVGVINGAVWATSVEYSEEPRPYSWHWVEKA